MLFVIFSVMPMTIDHKIQEAIFQLTDYEQRMAEVEEIHRFGPCIVFSCWLWCSRHSWCITVNVIRQGNAVTCEYSNVAGTSPDYILVVDDVSEVYRRKDYVV